MFFDHASMLQLKSSSKALNWLCLPAKTSNISLSQCAKLVDWKIFEVFDKFDQFVRSRCRRDHTKEWAHYSNLMEEKKNFNLKYEMHVLTALSLSRPCCCCSNILCCVEHKKSGVVAGERQKEEVDMARDFDPMTLDYFSKCWISTTTKKKSWEKRARERYQISDFSCWDYWTEPLITRIHKN